jgi:hypothetical protein
VSEFGQIEVRVGGRGSESPCRTRMRPIGVGIKCFSKSHEIYGRSLAGGAFGSKKRSKIYTRIFAEDWPERVTQLR